ncbi:MFS transporter [Streptacidiphilus carbonis]|uniref:MFS transporter n=1 Tax=Streptacidiphilus carbonis TaxID=105422 RepID=UPI0005A9C972|nr:MFS transporter [Streptacidiphilus carbonis]
MSRPVRGGASYRAVLALPHARSLFGAAMLARLCYGVLPLPLLLTLRQATGSYAAAGTAVGLFGLLAALLGPARARLVERRPGTLLLLAGAYAALLATVSVIGRTGAESWVAITLAGLTGLVPPPVGPLMRVLWGTLATDPGLRQRALGLDTVSESAVFAAGPAIGGTLIAAASAPVALAACAGLVLAGFAALAAAIRRAPARLHPTTGSARRGRGHHLLRTPGFAAVLLVVLGSACAVAALEIGAVAVWGAGRTGALLTGYSVAGVVGGLAYARRSWRSSPARRMVLLGAVGAVCFALPVLVPSAGVGAVAFLGIGICEDAQLVTAYLVVDATVADGARMEAGAWVNTVFNLGSALGSACAGALLDRSGPGAVFLAAAAVAGAAVCAAAAGGRSGTVRPPVLPGSGSGSGVDDGDLAQAEGLEGFGD